MRALSMRHDQVLVVWVIGDNNEFLPHGSLHVRTPWERYGELLLKTPFTDEVEALYDPLKERLHHQNYKLDLG